MRRALRLLSTVLIVAGVLCVVDAVLTVTWQEPASALYAKITQDRLNGRLETLERRPLLVAAQRRALRRLTATQRVPVLARAFRRRLKPGDPIGRIRIPRIGASYVVVEGDDAASLRKGPGHFHDTPLPGLPGTVAIAGHRTTYLAPFRHIDELRHGDAIALDTPYARFTYRVQSTRIVLPDARRFVTRAVGYDRLALSACQPLYSASHRIIVFARLVRTVPAPGA
jgi:sortase A